MDAWLAVAVACCMIDACTACVVALPHCAPHTPAVVIADKSRRNLTFLPIPAQKFIRGGSKGKGGRGAGVLGGALYMNSAFYAC